MQNLLEDLTKALEKDESLVIDGQLNKALIEQKALSLDKELLTILKNEDSLKKHFFEEIEDVLIFDKVKFQQFIHNKSFLPDSYTSFKNKIGLTDSTGNYVSQQGDVVLAWPHKDCVLQGGQDKEDAKREEIFWNETLAPDDIDRLLVPKVFTSWKKYDKDGEHKVETPTLDDNLLIKGNNLLALHSLAEVYRGKVKLIYIDPPYNTEVDSFKYNDRFTHSTWLSFLKSRLEIAKELLNPNGILFINIGDQELHYLKVLADDVFGRDKFIATIPRKTRSGKTDVPWKLSQDFDWLLIYTKEAPRTTQLFKRAIERRYHTSEDYPNDKWRLSDLTKQTPTKDRPNSDFTLVNPKNGDEFPVNPNRSWAVTKDTVQDYIGKGKIVFPGDYDFLNIKTPAMRVFHSEEVKSKGEDFDKTYVSSDFLNNAMDDLLSAVTNKKGTDEMVELFGEKAFSYPKNELLLSRIIEYATEENDLICDFFIGSGTTAAVAHKMGRRFIGIEQMDYIEEVTKVRLKKVIEGEQGGISKEVEWEGGGSFVYAELQQANQRWVEDIQEAKNTKALSAIWEKMKEKAFISYKVDSSSIDEHAEEFAALSLDDQKRFLIEVLDKNQLYVNYSEMEDEDYGVSEEDKKLTKAFYDLKGT